MNADDFLEQSVIIEHNRLLGSEDQLGLNPPFPINAQQMTSSRTQVMCAATYRHMELQGVRLTIY